MQKQLCNALFSPPPAPQLPYHIRRQHEREQLQLLATAVVAPSVSISFPLPALPAAVPTAFALPSTTPTLLHSLSSTSTDGAARWGSVPSSLPASAPETAEAGPVGFPVCLSLLQQHLPPQSSQYQHQYQQQPPSRPGSVSATFAGLDISHSQGYGHGTREQGQGQELHLSLSQPERPLSRNSLLSSTYSLPHSQQGGGHNAYNGYSYGYGPSVARSVSASVSLSQAGRSQSHSTSHYTANGLGVGRSRSRLGDGNPTPAFVDRVALPGTGAHTKVKHSHHLHYQHQHSHSHSQVQQTQRTGGGGTHVASSRSSALLAAASLYQQQQQSQQQQSSQQLLVNHTADARRAAVNASAPTLPTTRGFGHTHTHSISTSNSNSSSTIASQALPPIAIDTSSAGASPTGSDDGNCGLTPHLASATIASAAAARSHVVGFPVLASSASATANAFAKASNAQSAAGTAGHVVRPSVGSAGSVSDLELLTCLSMPGEGAGDSGDAALLQLPRAVTGTALSAASASSTHTAASDPVMLARSMGSVDVTAAVAVAHLAAAAAHAATATATAHIIAAPTFDLGDNKQHPDVGKRQATLFANRRITRSLSNVDQFAASAVASAAAAGWGLGGGVSSLSSSSVLHRSRGDLGSSHTTSLSARTLVKSGAKKSSKKKGSKDKEKEKEAAALRRAETSAPLLGPSQPLTSPTGTGMGMGGLRLASPPLLGSLPLALNPVAEAQAADAADGSPKDTDITGVPVVPVAVPTRRSLRGGGVQSDVFSVDAASSPPTSAAASSVLSSVGDGTHAHTVGVAGAVGAPAPMIEAAQRALAASQHSFPAPVPVAIVSSFGHFAATSGGVSLLPIPPEDTEMAPPFALTTSHLQQQMQQQSQPQPPQPGVALTTPADSPINALLPQAVHDGSGWLPQHQQAPMLLSRSESFSFEDAAALELIRQQQAGQAAAEAEDAAAAEAAGVDAVELDADAPTSTVLVFHCEFSSNRAPEM